LTLLLAATKSIIPVDARFRKHDWTDRYGSNPPYILYGKTIVILGYGSIGSHLGRACHALGMTVHGICRSTNKRDDFATLHTLEDLPSLLPAAQVLAVCLPLSSHTKGIIGDKELKLLPSKSIIVNVARGAIIDEAALYENLKSGHIFAAGLDAWYNYPSLEDNNYEASRKNTKPSRFEFEKLDNVVMSPHRGGTIKGPEVELERLKQLANLLNGVAKGEEMQNKLIFE